MNDTPAEMSGEPLSLFFTPLLLEIFDFVL